MNKIYLVTAHFGSYDDSWVNHLGIFSTPELAESVKSDFEKGMKNQAELPFPDSLSLKGFSMDNTPPNEDEESWNILDKWVDDVQDARDFSICTITIFNLDNKL